MATPEEEVFSDYLDKKRAEWFREQMRNGFPALDWILPFPSLLRILRGRK